MILECHYNYKCSVWNSNPRLILEGDESLPLEERSDHNVFYQGCAMNRMTVEVMDRNRKRMKYLSWKPHWKRYKARYPQLDRQSFIKGYIACINALDRDIRQQEKLAAKGEQPPVTWDTVKGNDILQDRATKWLYKFDKRLTKECYLEPVNPQSKAHEGIWVSRRAFDRRAYMKVGHQN